MIIYFALIIPPIVAFAASWMYSKKVVWWEVLIPIGIGSSFLLLTASIGTFFHTRDTEFWGGFATRTEYYEAWNEEVPCTHTKYCTNSKGETYSCGTEHSYDVDDHPPKWVVYDTNGLTVDVEPVVFKSLCSKWGNKTFVDLHRSYHTKDGDKYVATWDMSREKARLIVTPHSYTNKVAVSDAVQHWEELSEDRIEVLFDYPEISNAYQRSLLGWNSEGAEERLNWINGSFGPLKQLRLFVLVFRNKPVAVAIDQETYWKGGNKNEFVLCVGVREETIDWGYAFSWTDDRTLVSDVAGWVNARRGQMFDPEELAVYLEEEIPLRWTRKSFSDFDWVRIDPPWYVILMCYLLTLASSIGASVWVVKNDVDISCP